MGTQVRVSLWKLRLKVPVFCAQLESSLSEIIRQFKVTNAQAVCHRVPDRPLAVGLNGRPRNKPFSNAPFLLRFSEFPPEEFRKE